MTKRAYKIARCLARRLAFPGEYDDYFQQACLYALIAEQRYKPGKVDRYKCMSSLVWTGLKHMKRAEMRHRRKKNPPLSKLRRPSTPEYSRGEIIDLHDAIAALPPLAREMIHRHYWDGIEYADMGYSTTKDRMIRHRAFTQLRRSL